MLKYWLVAIFNLPLVTVSLGRSISAYRQGRISSVRLAGWVLAWSLLAIGLIFAYPIYTFLQTNHLSDSPPLSIFGVFTITGVVLALTLCVRLYARTDKLEQQLAKLNRELSIRLSEHEGNKHD